MKNQKITNKKSEANPYNISPEEINLDLTKLQEERLKLLSEISKGQFVNTDLSYFYDLMRFYVDNATVESKKITTEFDVSGISVGSGKALNENSVFSLGKEDLKKYNIYQEKYQKLKKECDQYNDAIISFCDMESSKQYLSYFKNGTNPLLWYIMVSNGEGFFFRDDVIQKIINNTSDENLTAKIDNYSLIDFIITQNIGGGRDLSKIIESLLNKGVVVNYEGKNVLYNLLNSNRMNSSKITSTLWPEMAEKCMEMSIKGDLELFYLFKNSNNINSNALDNVKKDITSFINNCTDGELLNKMLCSALRSNHGMNSKIHNDAVFSTLNMQDIFNKIKITPETLYEIIKLEPHNKLLFDSAVRNILKQVEKDSTILDKQQEITRFLGTPCDNNGFTPFLLACEKGWDNAIITLINLDKSKSYVKQEDAFGNNALDIAIGMDFVDTSKILIKAGIPISEKAFISAVKGNQETMVQLLLENGANPNSCSYEKLKKLENQEIMLDKLESLQIFESDKNISIKPNLIKGSSALEIAIDEKNNRMVSILVGSGASIRDENDNYLKFYSKYKKDSFNQEETLIIDNYFSSEPSHKNNLSFKLAPNEKENPKEILINQELEILSSYAKTSYARKVIDKINEVILDINSSNQPNQFSRLIIQGMNSLKSKVLDYVVVIRNQDETKISNSIMPEISAGKTYNSLLLAGDPISQKVFNNNKELIAQGKFSEVLEIISKESETNKSIKVSSAKQMSGSNEKESNIK